MTGKAPFKVLKGHGLVLDDVGTMNDKMITLRWNDNSSIEKGFEVQHSNNGVTYYCGYCR